MIRATGAVAVLTRALWANVADARFAPVEDRRYRYEIDETRVADGVTRRFHADRSVVFHRTASSFDAVVTLEAVRHGPANEAGAMFQIAIGALLQRPLHFRLDGAGHVTEVEDTDAAVALIADAIERFGTARRDLSRALAAPLRQAPSERKAAMLVSILQPIVLSDEAGREPGNRPVILPNRPPLPAGAQLTGSETVVRDDPTSVTITVQAAGTVAQAVPQDAPGATSLTRMNDAAAGVTVRQVRTIDAVSGLLRESVETSETTLPGAKGVRRAVVETVVHVGREAP